MNYSAPLLLLAEDDADAAQLFHHVFLKVCPEWQFVRVSDGLEAVAFIMDQTRPDVVVTDLQMTKMTGQELISWLRANSDLPRIPILVLSCNSGPYLADDLRALGADEYICKFSTINELKDALGRFTLRTSFHSSFHTAALR